MMELQEALASRTGWQVRCRFYRSGKDVQEVAEALLNSGDWELVSISEGLSATGHMVLALTVKGYFINTEPVLHPGPDGWGNEWGPF